MASAVNCYVTLNIPKLNIRTINYIGFLFGPKGSVINYIQKKTNMLINLPDKRSNKLCIKPNKKYVSSNEDAIEKLNYCVHIIISILKSAYNGGDAYIALKEWEDQEIKVLEKVKYNMQKFPEFKFLITKKKIIYKLISERKLDKSKYFNIPIVDDINIHDFKNIDEIYSKYRSELNVNYNLYLNEHENIYIENYADFQDEILNNQKLRVTTPVNTVEFSPVSPWKELPVFGTSSIWVTDKTTCWTPFNSAGFELGKIN
jgi:hypothetical protein